MKLKLNKYTMKVRLIDIALPLNSFAAKIAAFFPMPFI